MGYIDPLPSERVRPLRKQVIVVVTASWQVRSGRGGKGLGKGFACKAGREGWSLRKECR